MEYKFEELLGKTLADVCVESDVITFISNEKERYRLYHDQNCCESVMVEDIIGDIKDLIGLPLTMAEEVVSADDPDGFDNTYYYSHTWTFYKLATAKGYVTIRWLGHSNGYYSESVSFTKEI